MTSPSPYRYHMPNLCQPSSFVTGCKNTLPLLSFTPPFLHPAPRLLIILLNLQLTCNPTRVPLQWVHSLGLFSLLVPLVLLELSQVLVVPSVQFRIRCIGNAAISRFEVTFGALDDFSSCTCRNSAVSSRLHAHRDGVTLFTDGFLFALHQSLLLVITVFAVAILFLFAIF